MIPVFTILLSGATITLFVVHLNGVAIASPICFSIALSDWNVVRRGFLCTEGATAYPGLTVNKNKVEYGMLLSRQHPLDNMDL